MDPVSVRQTVDLVSSVPSSPIPPATTCRASSPLRARSAANPTVEELKKQIPVIFGSGKSLDDYFAEELFISENLIDLPENFSLQGHYGAPELRAILRLLNDLNNYLDTLDSQLHSNYHFIKHSMKLEILTNVRSYKQLNNSRVMVNGLINCKYTLQNYVHGLKDLDHYINDICEKLEDTALGPPSNEHTIKTLTYLINSDIKKLSRPTLNTVLHRVMKVFEEYVKNFNTQNLGDNDIYVYEIIALDDHLKSLEMSHEISL